MAAVAALSPFPDAAVEVRALTKRYGGRGGRNAPPALDAVPASERRTTEILDMVGLTDKADAYPRTLSGGRRRRLLIAKAMVLDPPILVLDEPTAGVDIDLRKQLWENVQTLNRRGVTILLTTHYLEEAEALCDRIAIIDHGKVVACDDRDALLGRFDSKTMHVETSAPREDEYR